MTQNQNILLGQSFTKLSGKEPVRKYSARLDKAMKELGLSFRTMDWSADCPVPKEHSQGATALISFFIYYKHA